MNRALGQALRIFNRAMASTKSDVAGTVGGVSAAMAAMSTSTSSGGGGGEAGNGHGHGDGPHTVPVVKRPGQEKLICT